MPRIELPPYFKSQDENANRRQDAEDAFFQSLSTVPREWNSNGVLLTVTVLAGTTARLRHGLGFKANGWMVRRVERTVGATAGPTLPFYRPGQQNDKNVLELFFQIPGTYTLLIF